MVFGVESQLSTVSSGLAHKGITELPKVDRPCVWVRWRRVRTKAPAANPLTEGQETREVATEHSEGTESTSEHWERTSGSQLSSDS